MQTFYEDFKVQLAGWRSRYAGRPREELLELAFLSLEREQLVSVTYHDDLLMSRLGTLPLSDDVRELIRHALAFTWKDEEMHAVYIRGLLWREGGTWVRLRSNWHFVAGLIAGWATFVQQHVRWVEAPVSRLVATSTLWAGFLTGTAPPSVKQHLRYHTFGEFCAFNVDAEKTAALAWERLAEVGREVGLDAEVIGIFERIRDDERLHERLFALLTEALAPDDSLQMDPEQLVRAIGAIHPEFLPRALRDAAPSPLGVGGDVAVVDAAPDRATAIAEAARRGGLPGLLEARAVALGKPVGALTVAVKTSFMLGVHGGDRSTIVEPAAVDALVGVLAGAGIPDVAVLEAPSVYERFHGGRSVAEVGEYFGFRGDYRLVDAASDPVDVHFPRGMVPAKVSATWRDADVRIVLGKLRSHPVQLVMLGLSTLEGLGSRPDTFHFPDRSAAPEISMVSLAGEVPPHFSVLDGWDGAPDGLAGMLGARSPQAPERAYAGRDALAVDLVAARHLGVRDPFASRALRTAIHWLGDPREHTVVLGTDAPLALWRQPYRDSLATPMRFLASFVYAHASGRGSLFVPAVDERAFPPLAEPGFVVRVGRRFVRWFFALPALEATR